MNIENLRGFLTVAETLNFREAAEKLYLSQPALSRQIAELEKELGAELLKRTTRSVSLTPAGRECLPFATAIIGRWDAMHRSARLTAAGPAPSLKLGIYGGRTTHYLAAPMERFKAECPQVQLAITTDTADSLRVSLQSGGLDLVCMMSPALFGLPNLDRLVLSEEFPSAMLPLSHPLAGKRRIAPAELAGEKLIMHSRKKSVYMYRELERIFTNAGVIPNIVATEDNDAMLVMRVLAGEALGILPTDWRIVGPELHRDTPAGTALVHLDCDNRPFARVAAWRRDNKNPVVELFLGMLRESLKKLYLD